MRDEEKSMNVEEIYKEMKTKTKNYFKILFSFVLLYFFLSLAPSERVSH